MSWFADLAGKAENVLNILDEQTGAALRHHNVGKSIPKKPTEHNDYISHPEAEWSRKKRPIPRAYSKKYPETKPVVIPNRKPSPTSPHIPQMSSNDFVKAAPRTRKPIKKLYSLNNEPRTLVGDMDREVVTPIYHKGRRFSLPSDLNELSCENISNKMEGMEIENAMLKNELNVMNNELTGLLERLHRTEEGESVLLFELDKDLKGTNTKLVKAELDTKHINEEKVSLIYQIEKLKEQITNITFTEIKKYKDKLNDLNNEISSLKKVNQEYEEKLKHLSEKSKEKDASIMKLESDLRHAQSNINELNNELAKSNAECRRLENEWDTYKHRVKSMLSAKDKEIKALQEGLSHSEDSRVLVDQIENLKLEREVLSEAIAHARSDSDDLRQYIETLEARHASSERVVSALRDALKDERGARNRAEAQYNALNKELKTNQIETGQTIASLRMALKDKEYEVNNLRESSSNKTSDTNTSALNVGDFGVSRDNGQDNEKVYHLTQQLVHRQGKLDSLLADNNMLRIQLEKMETKYKADVQAVHTKSHSVVHLQDGDRARPRSHVQIVADAPFLQLSRQIGVYIRRNPIFRLFIIVYMLGLHFWVVTVLFASTPENVSSRPTKL